MRVADEQELLAPVKGAAEIVEMPVSKGRGTYFALVSADQQRVSRARLRPQCAGGPPARSRRSPYHRQILNYAIERLRNKLEYTTVGCQLLPRKLTLTRLERVCEAILGRAKRDFRRKMELLEILTPLTSGCRKEPAGPPGSSRSRLATSRSSRTRASCSRSRAPSGKPGAAGVNFPPESS